MEIINLNKAGESHSMHSWPDHLAVPDGWAVVSDELDRSIYYDHNGFVVLTTATEERVTGSHQEPKEVTKTNEDGEITTETIYETVEDVTIVTVVTAWEPDLEAWEAWKAEQPEPGKPEPSTTEILNALLGVTG